MPIRLNFLAEAQALEEQRRRDPVKRAIVGGVVLVVGILIWSSSLMFQKMAAESNVSRLEADLNSRQNEYKQILDNERKLNESRQKLVALNRLATNRFLMGNLLNGMQKTVVDNVQLVHLQVEQKYIPVEAKTTSEAVPAAAAKPSAWTEKISITLDARDNSPSPGDGVGKFQESLSRASFFQSILGRTNGFKLKAGGLGIPQQDPDGRTFLLFTLEAHLPDKTR